MAKPTVILLHGALGAGEQFAPLVPLLHEQFDMHCFDFEGHGAAPLRGRPFRMEHFAENVLDYLREHEITQAHFFGYSMGGICGSCPRVKPS